MLASSIILGLVSLAGKWLSGLYLAVKWLSGSFLCRSQVALWFFEDGQQVSPGRVWYSVLVPTELSILVAV